MLQFVVIENKCVRGCYYTYELQTHDPEKY